MRFCNLVDHSSSAVRSIAMASNNSRGPKQLRPRVSASQHVTMREYMKKCPGLAKGYPRTPEGRRVSNAQWGELANLLNSYGDGVFKNPKQWAKYYNDHKSKLKAKKLANRRHPGGTEGGSPSMDMLNEPKEDMLDKPDRVLGGLPGAMSKISDVDEDMDTLNDTDDSDVRDPLLVNECDISNIRTLASTTPIPTPPSPRLRLPVGTQHTQPRPTSPVEPPIAGPVLPRADMVRPLSRHARPGARVPLSRGNGPHLPQTLERCLSQMEESRNILSQIETDRVKAEIAHATALSGVREELAKLVRTYTHNSEVSTIIQERHVTAMERLAAAAERRARVEERRLQNEERGYQMPDE